MLPRPLDWSLMVPARPPTPCKSTKSRLRDAEITKVNKRSSIKDRRHHSSFSYSPHLLGSVGSLFLRMLTRARLCTASSATWLNRTIRSCWDPTTRTCPRSSPSLQRRSPSTLCHQITKLKPEWSTSLNKYRWGECGQIIDLIPEIAVTIWTYFVSFYSFFSREMHKSSKLASWVLMTPRSTRSAKPWPRRHREEMKHYIHKYMYSKKKCGKNQISLKNARRNCSEKIQCEFFVWLRRSERWLDIFK